MLDLLIKKVVLNDKETDIAVAGGKIVKITPGLKRQANKVIDGRGKAVLPGFYNLHTHAAMTLLRGYAEDMELDEWLTKKIWPAEAKLTEKDSYWGTKLACLEMIKSGTVCFSDMYFYPEASMKAIKESGLRGYVGLILLDGHPEGSREALERNWRLLQKKQTDDVKLALAPHSIYTVSEKNLRWVADFARKNKLLIHCHSSETEREVKRHQRKHKCRPVEFLDKIGFLGPNVILAHAVWLSAKEIKILAKRKCHVVYNPSSNMKLGSGAMRFLELKAAGVNICLGSDGAASNNNLDMIEEMKIGGLLQKLSGNIKIGSRDMFLAATRNGARALKLKSGIIKEKHLADFILLDTERLEFFPGLDLVNDLVWSASSECVETVVVAGRVLLDKRDTLREKKIIKNLKKKA